MVTPAPRRAVRRAVAAATAAIALVAAPTAGAGAAGPTTRTPAPPAAVGVIAWSAVDVDVEDAVMERRVGEVLARIAAEPGVLDVVSPWDTEAIVEQIDRRSGAAFATLTLTPEADPERIRAVTQEMSSGDVQVDVAGGPFGSPDGDRLAPVGVSMGVALVLVRLLAQRVGDHAGTTTARTLSGSGLSSMPEHLAR